MIHQKAKQITILLTLLLGGVLLSYLFEGKKEPISYWLWAGITAKDAPPNSELYIYQGLISNTAGTLTYRRIGLYPHPVKSKKLLLVYRLEGDLPDAGKVVSIFQNSVMQWRRHSVVTDGLQLDFDSPTSKLLLYSNFLKEVRQQLPKQYTLSITGLGDWSVYSDKQVMQSIAESTDEIVFQLYQGWHPLPNIEIYIQALKNYPLPFRVGLLSRYPSENHIATLQKNGNFHGVIYFIQKPR